MFEGHFFSPEDLDDFDHEEEHVELASEIKEYSDDEDDDDELVLAIPVHTSVPGAPAVQMMETVVILEPVTEIAVITVESEIVSTPAPTRPPVSKKAAAAPKATPSQPAKKATGTTVKKATKKATVKAPAKTAKKVAPKKAAPKKAVKKAAKKAVKAAPKKFAPKKAVKKAAKKAAKKK